MLTFNEFTNICEGKKSTLPPNAVPGTYQEKDGVTSYTLAPYEGSNEPIGSAKKVTKMLDKQGGIGGKSIKKYVKSVQKIKEDIEQRRRQLRQRQQQQIQAQRQRVADYQAAQQQATQDRIEAQQQARQDRIEAQKEARQKQKERKEIKQELRRELQTEQTPTMEPNEYNKQIAR